MCSWCYAFAPVLKQLRQQLPEPMQFVTLLGGLAADTDLPMPAELQQQLQATWRRIEQKVPGIHFNYDFWSLSEQTRPRRATYPACRAVIAAEDLREPMFQAIQRAYYQQARNPSDDNTLIELAEEIGLVSQQFQKKLNHKNTQQELQRQISLSRQLNVSSFPSLVLKIDSNYWPVNIDYHHVDNILQSIKDLLP